MADLRIIMNILSGPYRWIWVSYNKFINRNTKINMICQVLWVCRHLRIKSKHQWLWNHISYTHFIIPARPESFLSS